MAARSDDGMQSLMKAMVKFLGSSLSNDTLELVEETIAPVSSQRNYQDVSTGFQDTKLKALAQAVIVPLKSGLQSFNQVSEILLRHGEDTILPHGQTFHDIRVRIVNAKQQLERSESIAAGELAALDRQTELLTAEQGQLATQKKQKELKLDQLWTQLRSNKSTLDNLRDVLSARRRNLDAAEETLGSMRRRQHEAEVKRDVGIGLLFVPIVGLIAGLPLALVGEEDVNQACAAVNTARAEVDSCESDVRSYHNQVSHYKSKISDLKGRIKEADDRIYRAEAELRALSGRREAVADVQAKMRQVVHYLGRLSGVGSVAELHTRHQVLLAPMMKVMEEMTAVVGRITGPQLLDTEGISSLVERMKSNQHQLSQLGHRRQSEHIGYY